MGRSHALVVLAEQSIEGTRIIARLTEALASLLRSQHILDSTNLIKPSKPSNNNTNPPDPHLP